jgi:hypothetical protein
MSNSPSTIVPATAAGMKSGLRRLRKLEAQQLSEIDTEIESLQAKIHALREQRKLIIKEAWAKGNVVRLQEVNARVTNGY